MNIRKNRGEKSKEKRIHKVNKLKEKTNKKHITKNYQGGLEIKMKKIRWN